MNILINAFGIQDSGGITVLAKLFQELKNDSSKKYIIVCNNHLNINLLIQKYQNIKVFKFLLLEKRGFLHRIYYENIVFNRIIKENRIDLVYNFSGSAQFFLNIPQITKVQNLLFYSKKIDVVYFQKKQYLPWIKQVFLKRFVFHSMLRQAKYIEIQSSHVRDCVSDFIDISDKIFYLKSDIDMQENLFAEPKEYDFTNKIKILYIVGPHFEYIHKNFIDFTNAMLELEKQNINFEISITLTKEHLHHSKLWDKALDTKTNFLGYINTKDIANNLFTNNTILISTSIIETLGLHVIEAVQNGILAIVPNENYAKSVYGKDILTYELFDANSLIRKIIEVTLPTHNQIKDIIAKNQKYLISNENTKYKNIIDVFNEILKEKQCSKARHY